MAIFEEVSAFSIAANAQALRFLEIGADNFGGMLNVHNILKDSPGCIFVNVKNNSRLVASIYLTITEQEIGLVLTSVLFGGVEFDEWYLELRDYYYALAKKYKCDHFTLMGRRGFKKYFPELEEVATVFRVKLNG